MPVKVHADIRHLDQDEFGQIAYHVMDHAFAIHNELGRFFNDDIYRDAVAARVAESSTEVLIEVLFDDFRKKYYMDLLVQQGAVVELKTLNRLGASQRSQLLTYLLLCELSHGKLINFRPRLVEHEFVNTQLKRTDRTGFQVVKRNWQDPGRVDQSLEPWLVAFLRDVGVGLDVHLYEAAVSHLLGGEHAVLREIDIFAGQHKLGRQTVRLAAPNWAFKVTTIKETDVPIFQDHARRFLNHTALHGLHWINVTRELVTFTTIGK